ncbi:MAG TPA: radical SAM protein [Acidobacteriaceae bacterium]|jgi:DNA repair photolyase|nr:radical SAM protein [Acidobacteriaceae bacterium]
MAKITAPSLFPILPSQPVGLARLAAQATHADDGHLIEFKAITARSLLNHSVSKRMGWDALSINPFRGCEFGCRYCYARYTHQFLQPEPIAPIPIGAYDAPIQPWARAFEHEIYLKENAAWLLEQELKKIERDHTHPRQEIAIGTATDPYQPIERRVGITRSILEVFARREGHRIGIITKSTLIERDLDLLEQIALHNTLVVHLTITTADSALARKLEPRAPRPDLRFATVRKLRQAGIVTGVLCSPLLPGINDTPRALEAVAGRAAAAGASFLGAHPLFLKSCSRPTWMSFVREHFPHLLDDYTKRFAKADFVDTAYREQVAQRVRAACRKHGLPQRSTAALLSRVLGAQAPAALARKAPQSARPVADSSPDLPAQGSLFAVA